VPSGARFFRQVVIVVLIVLKAHAVAALARDDVFELMQTFEVDSHLGNAPADLFAQFTAGEGVMFPVVV